jgi:hypothetical protein
MAIFILIAVVMVGKLGLGVNESSHQWDKVVVKIVGTPTKTIWGNFHHLPLF